MNIKRWLVALAGAGILSTTVAQAEPLDIQLHYVGPTEGSAWAGLQQGLDEANLQGEFLGQKYSLVPIELKQLEQLESVTAVLMATDANDILELAEYKQFSHVPVININSGDDTLRAACLPNLLSISASDKMKQDALNQWLAKHPDSTAVAQGWHKDFVKFAASQLNKRYAKTHNGESMDDDAWAGWASVKLLSDTVARTQSADSAAMLNYLKNDIAFDGQKGVGSTFRDTGQLRQIVLIVDNDKIVAEAPLRGTKGGLDSLGLASCPTK
jgi:hypothetical protein